MTSEHVSKAARLVGLVFGALLSAAWLVAIVQPMGY